MPPRKRKLTTAFRGPTPENVFQIVDYGAGRGQSVEARKNKHPERNYAAVDPYFRNDEERFRELQKKGIIVFPGRMLSFIRKMKRNGQKTRHVTIEMPYEYITLENEYDFRKFLKEVPNFLLPNGKVFITSEYYNTLINLQKISKRLGYKTRWLKSITNGNQIKHSPTMASIFRLDTSIYRLEITFGLKKAIPSKYERRKIAQPKKKKK
ncbi:MAG: hypothetical protein Q7S21_03650 [archaeon]|nr:hypothetical protein [archaeon]